MPSPRTPISFIPGQFLKRLLILLALFAVLPGALFPQVADSLILFPSAGSTGGTELRTFGYAEAAGLGSEAIRFTGGHPVAASGVLIKGSHGYWDLSGYRYVLVDVSNNGTRQVKVRARLSEKEGTDLGPGESSVVLNPGQGGSIWIGLRSRKPEWIEVDLSGMVSFPWGHSSSSEPGSPGGYDLASIKGVQVYVRYTAQCDVQINGIRAGGIPGTVDKQLLTDPDAFFPFIDEFGQYCHEDWPGKIRTAEDLDQERDREAAFLAEDCTPSGWNKFGGWADGPQLEATGWFRTAKYNGKWWLVDPEGRLFISAGVNHVEFRGNTPVGGHRREWFQDLPEPGSELGQFYSDGPGGKFFPASAGAEVRKVTYDFGAANLFRKYGPEWQSRARALVHQRLRSWGFNTIGNWSDGEVIAAGRTPYTANLVFRGKPLQGSMGYWAKFPDVFDPSFAQSLSSAMEREAETSARDPWCIGYFAGNEMEWGGGVVQLALDTLACPAEQVAKQVFVGDLRDKYTEIEMLNSRWGTGHASWDALLECVELPDPVRAHEDLAAFHRKTSDTFFSKVRDAIKAVAPNHLFIGCRFAGGNPSSISSATQFCDVVSFNYYGYSLEGFALPDPADVPLLLTEFSFWSNDHGSFNGAGLNLDVFSSQEQRARAFREFVRSILAHPQFVGYHYFKYQDQPLTGRSSDGENFQFGLVDITDSPYVELTRTTRLQGQSMYLYRLAGIAVLP